MLFIHTLITFTLLLDNPGRPIGRTDPQQPLPSRGPDSLSAWNRIQPDIDRSTGRIVDEPTYQLDRAALLRSLDAAPFDPIGYMRVFQMDRDRWLRIDQRQLDQARLARQSQSRQREAAMKLKEYELFINAGSDPSGALAQQAQNDRMALERLSADRDSNRAAVGADRAAIEKIEQDYQRERARILGFTDAPTTQPASN